MMNWAQLTEADVAAHVRDRRREHEQRLAVLDRAIALAGRADRGSDDAAALTALKLVREVIIEIHDTGFAVVPSLVDADAVERLRRGAEPFYAAARDMFDRLDPRLPRQTIHVQNVLAKSRVADEILLNPLLRAIVAGVLGHDFQLGAGVTAIAPDPGCSAQGLHRDDGCYSALPRPRPPLVLTAALALDDFTADNGATRVVPGSCAWAPSREPTAENVHVVSMAAGSLLIYDGAMFHGGGANTSPCRTRRTLTINYTRGWLRTQFNQFLSVPRAEVLGLPADVQRDLGYRLSADGLGGCDNQDPLAYLRRLLSGGGDGCQTVLGRELDDGAAVDECTPLRSTNLGR
jgi:ectoine hydroxylase-related dioxygenase (phytanoyl-CoA dioxygenase family)